MYDTACCPKKASSCCRLSFNLSAVAGWADNWSTVFNAVKFNQLLISRTGQLSGKNAEQVALNKVAVPCVKKTKHLGLMIATSLSWSDHVQTLLQSLNYRLYVLKRLAYRTPRTSQSVYLVSNLYKSLVQSRLEYGSAIWNSCSKLDSPALECVQLSVA